ncbi:MAG: lycopene cyclase domain-containing protein [bacterium]|nr:MAG: lycopene cyclase domain-containing protein [bacterium]
MNSEYLIFNIIVISGPLSLSFDRKVHFVDKWNNVFKAIIVSMAVFVAWDSVVTERHWWFSDQYTLGIKSLKLPIEEWLFFITIPYASLFIWEVFTAYFKNREYERFKIFRSILYFGIPFGIALLMNGKEYAGLVLIALGFVALLDWKLKTNIFIQLRTIQYLTISTLAMLIFNGYLTWRPVVLYGEAYQLGFRIFTIPIEDFFYGYALIILCTILYEYFKRRQHG